MTAAWTGKAGMLKDVSLLLVQRGPGLDTTQIKMTSASCCGMANVIMRDVRVPMENLMAKEGRGFLQTTYNFNQDGHRCECRRIRDRGCARQLLLGEPAEDIRQDAHRASGDPEQVGLCGDLP